MRPQAERPSLRGSSVWTNEEDAILIERYNEFRRGGRIQGYALFVASGLPLKTEKQVRDRVRTLRGHGIIADEVEPRPAEVAIEEVAVLEPASPVEDRPGVLPAEQPPLDPVEPAGTASGDGDVDLAAGRSDMPAQACNISIANPPPIEAAGGSFSPEGAGEFLQFLREIGPVCAIGERLKELVESDQVTSEAVDRLVEMFTEQLLALREEEEAGYLRPDRPPQPAERGRRSNRTRWRVSRFAKTQEIFKKNPSRLAELVLQDQLGELLEPQDRVAPPRDEIVALYRDLWGRPAGCEIPSSENIPLPDEEVRFLAMGEVRKRLARLKPGGAPGPDGITKKILMRSPNILGTLTVLFNILLFKQIYPRSWKRSRTTFIPKRGKDLTQAENWRPITIAPLLARIYSGLLETRLNRFVSLSARQRGFRPGPGCHLNCTILSELIRLGKKSRLVGVLLDIRKAFDMVDHRAIDAALAERGVPRVLRLAVRQIYEGATTSLGSFGVDVAIMRGVKQGDPLSPLLFNLIIDPILAQVSELGEGFRVGTAEIAVTAYADDLVLLSSSQEGMNRQLALVGQHLQSVGLSLSISKCVGFALEKKGDAWIAPPTAIFSGDSQIRQLGVNEPFTYLGLTYTLAKGFSNDHHLKSLEDAIARVGRLALKPQQKSQLLMQYVVPTSAHRMTVDLPSLNTLRRIDATVRREVKRFLHLGPFTTDCLLYARKRDGGLGFPQLSTQVRICALRAGIYLYNSSDPVHQELVRTVDLERRLANLAVHLGLEWPTDLPAIAERKTILKSGVMRTWADQVSQGVGVESFWNDPVGNRWLLRQDMLRPGQFIDALKLRTNTHGTRVAIKRADRAASAMCRRCHAKPETLGHVIGECTAGRRARIHRHNAAVGLLEGELRGTVESMAREQIFTLPDGTHLRPDLVVKSRDSVQVIDITVPFENADSLQGAALEKIRKYQALLPTVREQFRATSGEVIPVVLGARGAFPKSTATALRRLGLLDQRLFLDLSLLALRSSIDIVRQHLDYGDMPPDRRRRR